MENPSFAWRGPRGSGKRTQVHEFLKRHAMFHDICLTVKNSTWYLNKGAAASAESEEDGDLGKFIPYEESRLHLGFDIARMSMSDKVFMQSILASWNGNQDVCLTQTDICMRFLVLYHAQYLSDESILQLQESMDKYPQFTVLLTTELPVPNRMKDYFIEIPVAGKDNLLANFTSTMHWDGRDVWKEFFKKTLENWSKDWPNNKVATIRQWCYTCLQRNLRWADVVMYWIEVVYECEWMTWDIRKRILDILWRIESGSGWILIMSYRIPILWEHTYLHLARELYLCRCTIGK